MTKLLMIYSIMLILLSMIMNTIYSMSFNYNKTHPLMLIFMLILLLIIASVNMSMYFNNHWFSFIMFLIIVGGMMIIFLYFISFSNNMNNFMKWMNFKNIPLKLSMNLMLFITMYFFMKKNNWVMNFNEINKIEKINFFDNNNLMYMYIYPKYFLTIISMIYLLLTMTIIVKICLIKKFNLRKFN